MWIEILRHGYKPLVKLVLWYVFVHICVSVASCMYLRKWLAVLHRVCIYVDAVRSFPCIYDVKNGEIMVTLVKDNAWKAIVDNLLRTSEMTLIVQACFLQII